MDIQGTTTGFTKLHLKATIISQNVEWRNQAPTIRIRWEITDHHRQILPDPPHLYAQPSGWWGGLLSIYL